MLLLEVLLLWLMLGKRDMVAVLVGRGAVG